jgi:tetratricopeptide (TPR) repeat protein
MRDFVSAHRDTFHFYDAAEALGDIAVAMNRPQDAARYYGQLENAPWPDMQFRGMVRMAEALRAAGGNQVGEALKRYEAIAASAVEGKEAERQKQFAIVGKVSCQAELGQADAGLTEIQTLIDATPAEDVELLARAYNALGACHRAASRPKDAILAYLHVDLLFSQQAESRAESLHYIVQLWTELGKPDRAEEAKAKLQTQYEGSAWARD